MTLKKALETGLPFRQDNYSSWIIATRRYGYPVYVYFASNTNVCIGPKESISDDWEVMSLTNLIRVTHNNLLSMTEALDKKKDIKKRKSK